MAGAPTQEHHDWLGSVLGVKVGDYLENKVGDGIPIKKDFEYKPAKLKFGKGWLTVQGSFVGSIECKAKIDSEDKTRLDAEKIVVEYGNKWVKETASKEVEKEGLFSNLKWEGMKVTGAWTTAIGRLELEIVLLTLDAPVKVGDKIRVVPKFATGKLTLFGVGVVLPDNTEVAGLKLTGMNVKLGGAVEFGPDAAEIIKEWLVEQAEKKAFDAVRSTGEKIAQAALEGLAIDALITGAIVVAGIATIAAAVYEAAKGDELKAIGDNIQKAFNALDAGWLAGASGQGAPGDPFGKAGFEAGKKSFDEAMAKIKAERPDVLDNEARDFVAAEVKKTWTSIPYNAADQLRPKVRENFWLGYLAAHTTFLTEKDAKFAFWVCFTDAAKRDASNPMWAKYLDQHKVGQYL